MPSETIQAPTHTIQMPSETMTTSERPPLIEPNLYLDFQDLAERLAARLRMLVETNDDYEAHDGSARARGDAVLDSFLLAAGMNQILEDHLHRELLGLRQAARHLPGPISTVTEAAGRVGHRLAMQLPRERRLADAQTAVAAIITRLADSVASRVLEAERGVTTEANVGASELLRLFESAVFPLDRLPPAVRREVQRLPNCFRSLDQQPADCLRLVERFLQRWPEQGRPLVVVGLRTSGNYLAPLYRSFLERSGCQRVSSMTMRPGSFWHPWERRSLAAIGAAGGIGLLVDDPPRTGVQLHQAARAVAGCGVQEVVLLLHAPGSADSIPERLRAYPSVVLGVEESAIAGRLSPACVQAALTETLIGHTVRAREGGDGQWLTVSNVEVDSVAPLAPERGHAGARIEARVLGQCGRTAHVTLYAEGVGLGYFGRHELAIAERLEGHLPAVYGVHGGVLFREWLPEEQRITPSRLREESDAIAGAMVGYVLDRRRELEVTEDMSLRQFGRETAWEMVASFLWQAFGRASLVVRPLAQRAARRLVRARSTSVGDRCTRADRWFGSTPTSLRKITFGQRGSAIGKFQSCDAVCDLADAASDAEVAGERGFGATLRERYEAETGERIDDERWLLYRLIHLQRRCRDALFEAAANRSEGDAAFSRVLALERAMANIHRDYFERAFLSDLAPRAAGPLCAIDIDGVLETRWVAFPAISRAGALALRSLALHGYRAVLASGRSLEEVRDRCIAYRLPGGVAEYGAVVYDHLQERTHSLVTDDDRRALDALRRVLMGLDGVYVDPAYTHSVRAHALSAGGRRGAVPEKAITEALLAAGVDGRVDVVQGALQTDFVAKGIEKGRGLAALMELFGEDVGDRRPIALAVGDSPSDLPMLALARKAFAPANAAPELGGRVQRLRSSYQTGLLRAVEAELAHRVDRCSVCTPRQLSSAEGKLLLAALGGLDGGKGAKVRQAVALAVLLVKSAPARDRL